MAPQVANGVAVLLGPTSGGGPMSRMGLILPGEPTPRISASTEIV